MKSSPETLGSAEVIPPDAGLVRVTACPHPFRIERVEESFPVGMTVAEILAALQPNVELRRFAHVWISGHACFPEEFESRIPPAGADVIIRVVPHQGEKDPLVTFLSVAVLAASVALGGATTGPLAATIGTTGVTYGTVAAIGLSVVSSLVITALVSPSAPSLDSLSGDANSSSPFLTGGGNRVRPWGVVPAVLGRHLLAPPLAAPAFTEVQGKDQFINFLFSCGVGKVDYGQATLGGTPLNRFEDKEIEKIDNVEFFDLPRIWRDTTVEKTIGAPLTKEVGWVTRRTEPDTSEISVDITLPNLIEVQPDGDRKHRGVDVRVEYSPAGEDDWSAGTVGKTFGVRETKSLPEPSLKHVNTREGGYDIVRRRRDRVVMHPLRGTLKVLKGERAEVAQTNISPMGAEYPFTPEIPVPQEWPARSIRIAEVVRESGETTIPGSRIKDMRPTKTGARFPFGSSFSANGDFDPGKTSPASDKIEIAAGTVIFSGFRAFAKTTDPLRLSFAFQPDEDPQEFDVRLRRATDDHGSEDSIFDKSSWSVLRSHRTAKPVTLKDEALVALRIRKSDQFTSGVVPEFRILVKPIVPDWDGTDWVDQTTRNPASWVRYVLTSERSGQPLPLQRVDLASLQDFHDWCSSKGYRYDRVIDFRIGAFDLAREIAAAGRAALTVRDGKWGVVIDEPKTVPVQHFTPRNSWGYSGNRVFRKLPEGFRVRFINREFWEQDERIVPRDGFTEITAKELEGLELPGVTDPDQIYDLARYHMAVASARPEDHSFFADIEAIVCQRGDLIKFSHDVPLFGLSAGRVKGVTLDGSSNVLTATLDEPVVMELGKTYDMRFRLGDGTSVLAALVTDPGEQATVTFAAPIPALSAPQGQDLFSFGETGQETVDLIVKAILPGRDLSFKIVAVDAAPGVHTAARTIPAFQSRISVPAGLQRPLIEDVRAGKLDWLANPDGTLRPRILVSLFRSSGLPEEVSAVIAQIRIAGTAAESTTGPWTTHVFDLEAGTDTFLDVEAGETYELRFRYEGPRFLTEWTAILSVTVEAQGAPPPDVTDLRIIDTVVAGVARRKLVIVDPANKPPDFLDYQVRYRIGTLAQWAGMESLPAQSIVGNEADVSTLPRGVITFAVRMRDTTDQLSANPLFLTVGQGDAPIDNIVLTVDESARGWPGTITGGALEAGGPEASGDGGLYLANPDAPYLPDDGRNGRPDAIYLPVQWQELTYETSIVPAVNQVPARLSVDPSTEGEGLAIGFKQDSQALYLPDGARLYLGGPAEDSLPYLPGPTDFISWQEGQQVVHERYDLRLTIPAGNVQGKITGLTFVLDVPDTVEVLDAVSIPSGGARLPITKTYRAIKSVNAAVSSSGAAAVLQIVDRDPVLGPLVKGVTPPSTDVAVELDNVRIQGY